MPLGPTKSEKAIFSKKTKVIDLWKGILSGLDPEITSLSLTVRKLKQRLEVDKQKRQKEYTPDTVYRENFTLILF